MDHMTQGPANNADCDSQWSKIVLSLISFCIWIPNFKIGVNSAVPEWSYRN